MTTSGRFKGLTEGQAETNIRQYGLNILTPPARKSVVREFMEKFRDPLIVILLVAGMLSIAISCYEYYALGSGGSVFFEPVGIFMAILLATGLSFVFEYKAGKEFDLLNKVNDEAPVRVIREGNVSSVPRSHVTVGDVVLLDTGEEVPADGKLEECTALSVDESALTGEPVCWKKTGGASPDSSSPFPADMVCRGSKVMSGHGVMKVTAVGDFTEEGKVFTEARIDTNQKTPLGEQLERLGNLIARGSYAVAALVMVARMTMYAVSVPFEWMGFIQYLLATVMIAVTLIVVAVPEGLPMAVTLSLAYSMRRMLRTNNLVRRLHACETMGATTVICTDKTGTLTRNRMKVREMHCFGTIDKSILHRAVAVNNTAHLSAACNTSVPDVIGNPTEGALLLWLMENGIDYRCLRNECKVVAELPFDTVRKFMATSVRHSGASELYVKGAPETVLDMCTQWPENTTRKDIEGLLMESQAAGMRTLAIGYKRVDGHGHDINAPYAYEGLTLLAIAVIADPVRTDVSQAIEEVSSAGIGVKMITGDSPLTALSIAREIGLWTEEDDAEPSLHLITGREFESLADEEAYRRVPGIKIIARARPMDKKRMVEMLQRHGEVVAVTGDGTNDAPALKCADVGLSMGDGTAVAKEASDITIIDSSFASIGRAVMWGRSLYKNIQRFLVFQLTVNVAACLTVLAGSCMGLESPLSVTQMLWVNLIMDTFAAIALASLPPSPEVMNSKPRRRGESIITPGMYGRIVGMGVLFGVFLIGLTIYMRHTPVEVGHTFVRWAEGHALSIRQATVFFTVFVFLQFWNMFNARNFGSRSSLRAQRYGRGFWGVMAMILLGQVGIVELGGEFFNVAGMPLSDWISIISATSIVAIGGQLATWIRKKYENDDMCVGN